MDQVLTFLQLLSAFDALGWFKGLTFIGVSQWVLVAACWWVIIGAGIIGPLFVGYVFLTHLDKVKKANGNRLPAFIWLVSFLPALIAVLCDVTFHLGWGSVIFWDFLPREWTLSQRMTRYWDGPAGYRRDVVRWVKLNTLIDSFDFRGLHIGSK